MNVDSRLWKKKKKLKNVPTGRNFTYITWTKFKAVGPEWVHKVTKNLADNEW